MTSPVFLSGTSANALISELRPTTLSQPALYHINALLDEILHLLISSSGSINPTHIRTRGIPAVFSADKGAGETTGPRALGRSAVAEAELEVRSWYESHPGIKKGAFPPDGQGTGIKGARAFPIREATDLLKLKCVTLSTLAPTTPPSEAYEIQVTHAWKALGGDVSDNTLDPTALWFTAILEHVCEHVLRQLSRVVARDSSIAVAGVQDLYVALCEDESIWGLFRRLQVKESLEQAIKAGTRQRKITPIKTSHSQIILGSFTNTKSSLPTSASLRDTSIDQSRLSSSTPVEHIVNHPERNKGPVAAVARAVSSTKSHNRSPSALSASTKTIVTAFQDQYDNENQRRPSADEDEFDALVRSGETMKVSLTPSRLKNFDMSPNRRAPASPTQGKYIRPVRPTQSPEIPESPTMPINPAMALTTDSSKAKVHSRSSSGNRLVARNAATIEEQANEDEEEFLDGPKAKKESLADMFASEPKEKRMSGSKRRVVPAVVLGSPPPQDRSTLPPTADFESVGRKTKRNDLSVHAPQPRDDLARSSKRSEAQELADFFSSTEPPINTLAPPSPIPEEPPKSAKSFKSFMSRMTGKKGPSKENDRPPMPSAFSQASMSVKRQKSTQSFRSGTATPAPPSAATSPQERSVSAFATPAPMPVATSPPAIHSNSFATPAQSSTSPYPDRTSSLIANPAESTTSPKNRNVESALHAAGNDARSDDKIDADRYMATGVAALTMGAGQGNKTVFPEHRMNEMDLGGKGDKERELGDGPRDMMTVATDASMGRKLEGVDMTQGRKPVPKGEEAMSKPRLSTTPSSTSQRSTRTAQAPAIRAGKSIPSLAPPISTNADEYVVVNRSDAMPTPINTLSPREVDTAASPMRPTPSSAYSNFTSDAVSFRTASEGTAPAQQDEPMTHEAISDKRQPTADPPSIPLADLVPLRGLLQHATSARECQLLLSAILSQLRVPHSQSSFDEVVDPESRVTAWLLAGREGPVDYPLQSSRSVMTSTTDTAGEKLSTPTLTNLDLDVGRVVSNYGEGSKPRDGHGHGLGTGTAGSGDRQEQGDGEGEGDGEGDGEGWTGAVRIPGAVESNRVRDEVVGL